MPLTDKVFIGGIWVASGVLALNTVGTMLELAEVEETFTGEAISDLYTLTAGAVAGGTATIGVTCASGDDNYLNGTQKAAVALDGVTIYTDIIPGVALVFSNTTVNANTSTVEVGNYVGSIDAFGVGAGTPQDATRHQAFNGMSSDVSEAAATLAPQAEYVKKIGSVFLVVDPYAPGATYKPAGGGSDRISPFACELTAVSGSGGSKLATLEVDGALLGADSIRDITTGLTQDSDDLKAVTGEVYEVITGDLTGVRFSIDPACVLNDTCNILIFPPRYLQITGDIAGVADAAGWGVADVPLTQAGESEGVIEAGEVAYYWSRVVVPAGSSSESNPWQSIVFLKAIQSEGADWLG